MMEREPFATKRSKNSLVRSVVILSQVTVLFVIIATISSYSKLQNCQMTKPTLVQNHEIKVDEIKVDEMRIDEIKVDEMRIDEMREESDPDEGNMWCPGTLLKAGAALSSSSHVWNNINDKILNSTYPILPTLDELNSTMSMEYKRWVDQLFSFHTASKLRRSVMHPAPPKQVAMIMKLVAEIKEHNSQISNEEDKRSLRILVVGGSVTVGMGCHWPENLGMPTTHWAAPDRCDWPRFLEKILNLAIFNGEDIVKIDNAATGGTTSDFGSILLDYRLYPQPEKVPDIVISSYSANEAREPDLERVFREYMQRFVQAVYGLQPCNDYAPLLILLDEYYGIPYTALEQSGSVYKMSNWFNVMSVDYASVVKFKLYVENTTYIPLFHKNLDLHGGIGMHIGIAWTLAFNIVNAMVNVCNDAIIGVENHLDLDIDSDKSNSTTQEGEEDNNEQEEHLHGDTVSVIDPNLLPNLHKKDEPPFQQVGSIGEVNPHVEHGKETLEMQEEFETNRKEKKEFCEKNMGSTQKCAWSWFFNRLQPMDSPYHIDGKMKEVLLLNEGWNAEGYPVRQPRAGWYTHSSNSTFSMKVVNVPFDIKYVVILSMKSYSAQWRDSKLALSTTVVKSPSIPDSVQNRTSAVDWNGESIFYIDGYHEVTTSVHFPHKFLINDGGVSAGESVILDAKLVGGSEFKIAGMALCAF